MLVSELFLTDLLFFICPFTVEGSLAKKLGEKSQSIKWGEACKDFSCLQGQLVVTSA